MTITDLIEQLLRMADIFGGESEVFTLLPRFSFDAFDMEGVDKEIACSMRLREPLRPDYGRFVLSLPVTRQSFSDDVRRHLAPLGLPSMPTCIKCSFRLGGPPSGPDHVWLVIDDISWSLEPVAT